MAAAATSWPSGVTDHQGHHAVREREHVVPFATDLQALTGRQVARGQRQAGQDGQRWQQRGLQGRGHAALHLQEPGAVQRESGQQRDIGEQGDLLVVEGLRDPPDGEDSQQLVAPGQPEYQYVGDAQAQGQFSLGAQAWVWPPGQAHGVLVGQPQHPLGGQDELRQQADGRGGGAPRVRRAFGPRREGKRPVAPFGGHPGHQVRIVETIGEAPVHELCVRRPASC